MYIAQTRNKRQAKVGVFNCTNLILFTLCSRNSIWLFTYITPSMIFVSIVHLYELYMYKQKCVVSTKLKLEEDMVDT